MWGSLQMANLRVRKFAKNDGVIYLNGMALSIVRIAGGQYLGRC